MVLVFTTSFLDLGEFGYVFWSGRHMYDSSLAVHGGPLIVSSSSSTLMNPAAIQLCIMLFYLREFGGADGCWKHGSMLEGLCDV